MHFKQAYNLNPAIVKAIALAIQDHEAHHPHSDVPAVIVETNGAYRHVFCYNMNPGDSYGHAGKVFTVISFKVIDTLPIAC